MATTYAPEAVPVAAAQPRVKVTFGVLLGLWLIFQVCLVIYFQQPPALVTANVPPQEFSAQRAMTHLQTIAKAPHPTGSNENHAVREYLVRELAALRADPQVASATVVDPNEAQPYVAATVQNVIGRFRGTTSGKAIVLMAHYDSAPTSPGASDDGAAVAALLETARALQAGPPLKNDVVILLTDGEELGLLGARAFVSEHSWAKDAGLVFNFEARGSSGPSMMFETSQENGWLIQEFAKSSTYAFANSLSGEIYRTLPNDTDFSVTKNAGMAGLNFAYINGLPHYHTQADSLENIDPRSLQHQGTNALAVARHFGNLDFDQLRQRDAVYFDVPGGFLINYSAVWIAPLAILTVVAFIGVVILGRRKSLLTFKGVSLGFAALIASSVGASLLVTAVWTVVRALDRGHQLSSWGETFNSVFYKIAFVLHAIAIFAAIYEWCNKRTSVPNLAVGAMLGWVLLVVASAILLPGGSYVFTWPLLFTLAGTAIIFYSNRQPPLKSSLVLAASSIPVIVLIGPLVYWLFVALTISAAGTVVILLALALGLLVPHLNLLGQTRRWFVPLGTAALSVIFIIAGLAAAGFDRSHPKTNHLFYALNADTSKAVWGSTDETPDEWTTQFLTETPKRERLPEFFPLAPIAFMQSEAVAVPLEAPQAQLLEDRREGDVRVLRLQLSSPRKAPVISTYLDASADVVSASLNGKAIASPNNTAENKQPWGLQYHGVPEEGAELTLRVRSSQPVTLRIDDRTFHLPVAPNISYRPRPGNLMPVPSQYSDNTLVTKSYTF